MDINYFYWETCKTIVLYNLIIYILLYDNIKVCMLFMLINYCYIQPHNFLQYDGPSQGIDYLITTASCQCVADLNVINN